MPSLPKYSLVICALIATSIADPEPIDTVVLLDGTRRSGQIDPRSDTSVLRLRAATESSVVSTAIAWQDIAEVHVGRKRYSPTDFERLRNESLRARVAPASPQTNRNDRPVSAMSQGGESLTDEPPPANRPARSESRISQLEIDVLDRELVFGSAASETAGPRRSTLNVLVRPMQRNGEIARVGGTLTLTVHGHSNRWFRPGRTNDARSEVLVLSRGTATIRPGDYGVTGARISVPLSLVVDDSTATHVELTAELVVAGSGVFRANAASVRLQSYSPLRDWHSQRAGTRTLNGDF